MLYTFTCPVCNISFTHKDKRTLCCSRKCANLYLSQLFKGEIHTFVCPVCGITFTHKDKRRLCCSAKCGHMHCAKQLTGRIRGKVHTEEFKKMMHDRMAGINNPRFGKHFKHTEETRRLLSINSKGKSKPPSFGRKISQLHKEGHYDYKAMHIPAKIRHRECAMCHADFIVKRSNYWRIKYCSDICRNKARSMHKIGNQNGQWQGGKSFEPYSPEFNKIFKESIRQLDNYKCQMCHINQNGKRLHVHHIDYDKLNNKIENLIVLCNSCHSQTMINREYWIQYFNSPHRKLLRKSRRWLMTMI